MDHQMHTTAPMHIQTGYPEWLELGVFALLALTVLVLLLQCSSQKSAARPNAVPAKQIKNWRSTPEIQLIMLALPLELLWEIAQFPLYKVWQEGDWSYILYGLAHCTLGDLLILLVVYWLVALLNRNRYWYQRSIFLNGLLFTVFGTAYTIYSEIINVRVRGTWEYTELMPIVPVIDIGGMPFLQWVLIPPVLLWLMRLLTRSIYGVIE